MRQQELPPRVRGAGPGWRGGHRRCCRRCRPTAVRRWLALWLLLYRRSRHGLQQRSAAQRGCACQRHAACCGLRGGRSCTRCPRPCPGSCCGPLAPLGPGCLVSPGLLFLALLHPGRKYFTCDCPSMLANPPAPSVSGTRHSVEPPKLTSPSARYAAYRADFPFLRLPLPSPSSPPCSMAFSL